MSSEPGALAPEVSPGGLARTLTYVDGAALIVGIVIGSGIFASPGRVLEQVGSVGMALVVWTAAGLLSLAGALCYAELGTALPVSGGEYAYLSRGLGPSAGFVFTWTQFFVLKTGSLAIKSIVFASYLGGAIFGSGAGTGDDDPRRKAMAIALILGLTAINCIGVRWGALIQRLFTALKLAALAGICALGFSTLLTQDGAGAAFARPFAGSVGSVSAFGIAMIAAMWAYEGWNNLNYVTEELHRPERNLPRAIWVGSIGVLVVYLLVNLAYLVALDPAELVASRAVASDLAIRVLGPAGGLLVALAVAISTFGSTNGTVLSGARIYHAAARDGRFPAGFRHVHPAAHTPVVSLLAQGLWACVLVIPGDFGSLVNYFSFAVWIFYALTVVALLRLRRRLPGPHILRGWLYWPVPLAFLTTAVFLTLSTLAAAPQQSLAAGGFMLLGVLVYHLRFRLAPRR
jgi:L-type amino acid transporter 9